MSTRQVVAPLHHPGPTLLPRVVPVPTTTRVERVELAAGRRLVDAIADEVERMGADSAQVELLGGSLGEVAYCFPALCTDGTRAVSYSETHHAVTPAQVVSGSATVGFRDGERFMHCHAAWFDAHGALRGGHLWPETFVGPSPLEVVVHALDGVTMTSATDEESRMPVFTPAVGAPAAGHAATTRRSVMSRLRPGVDLHRAVQQVMRAEGFASASVRGSLGSLVGAVLLRADGAIVVDGPATEISLSGTMTMTSEGTVEHHLSAVVIDRHGTVHAGELIGGENIVAVTFELLVEELTA